MIVNINDVFRIHFFLRRWDSQIIERSKIRRYISTNHCGAIPSRNQMAETRTSNTSYRKSTSDFVHVEDWTKDIPGHLSEDSKTYLFPSVTGKTSSDKVTEWLISVRIYATLSDAKSKIGKSMVITPEIMYNTDFESRYVARILIFSRIGDGKIQKKVPTFVTAGKNQGRSGETNVFCQALRDALGLYNKHRRRTGDLSADSGESSGDEDDEQTPAKEVKPSPMLAKLYSDVYDTTADPSPIYVQRKYNGVRAIGTVINDERGSVVLYSRKGLNYSGFTSLKKEIADICSAWNDAVASGCAEGAPDDANDFSNTGLRPNGNLYIDGELYKHDVPLPVISGIVRRVNDDAAQSELMFIVYDVFIVNKGASVSNELRFDERFAIMRAIQRSRIGKQLRVIQFADTYTCVSSPERRAIDGAMEMYRKFLSEGYEGAIVRINAPYMHSANDHHSNVLLKIKPVRDAEYKITGYTTGIRGKAAGAVLFECETPDGKHTFNVTPMGTIESRVARAIEFERIMPNGKTVFENEWLGRQLTVIFDELSPNGVPQRARTESNIRTCD